MLQEILLQTQGRGLHECTAQIVEAVDTSRAQHGLCTVFIQHTSASLLIQENADPSAKRDLERWLDRFVPDGTAWQNLNWTHTDEGPDDMPSHIRAAITASSLSIPIHAGKLMLGTWQGVYLWEHRLAPHSRRLAIHTLRDPA